MRSRREALPKFHGSPSNAEGPREKGSRESEEPRMGLKFFIEILATVVSGVCETPEDEANGHSLGKSLC